MSILRFIPLFLALFLIGCSTTKPTPESTVRMSPMPTYLVGRDLPEELIALERAGDITAAEAWIDARIRDGADPGDPLVIERERLRRLRRDYRQTPDQLLARLQQDIPDLAMADIDRWREAGLIQWVEIDGDLLYFRKEPSNLYRLSEEARRLRDEAAERAATGPEGDPNTRQTDSFDLHEEVERFLALAKGTGKTNVGEIRIHCTHTVTVDPGAVPEGETIRCWIPYPQEYERQRNVELIATNPPGGVLAPNGHPMRTVYMEMPAPAETESAVFSVEYAYSISAFVPDLNPGTVTEIDRSNSVYTEFTESRPPHVDLTPEVRALAAEIVGDETNPLLKAEKIFHWMDENIRYCSEMEYSTFSSITDKVMTERKGDCGIHVLMFVALCRAAGVPARWQSGWAMRPGGENLHDWAEFYVEPWGWLPADPSYGLRKHANPAVREFFFGHIDPFRLIANLDYERQFQPAKTHWRSDNIDNQRGEVEWKGGNLFYDHWSYKMEAKYEGL